jgi:hypothetical protein
LGCVVVRVSVGDPCVLLLPYATPSSPNGGAAFTVKLLLVPVCPLPSFAVMVMPAPVPVKVTEPDHTPFDQPLVPVLVGLIAKPPETDRPTELE